MAGFLVANYRITNPEAYGAYVPAVMPTLAAHDAEVLVADYDSERVEGEPASVTIVESGGAAAPAFRAMEYGVFYALLYWWHHRQPDSPTNPSNS